MKLTAKYALVTLGLVACCVLVVFNFNKMRASSFARTHPRRVKSRAGGRERKAGRTPSFRIRQRNNTTREDPNENEGTKDVPGGTGNIPGGTENVPGGTGGIPGRKHLERVRQYQSGKKIQVGKIPEWWKNSWQRSIVFRLRDQFVGEQPLFGPCTNKGSKHVAVTTSDDLYDFVDPQGEYMPPDVSKNPCWWRNPTAKEGLRCVPYIYLVGVAKCGTTDLAKRLRTHPEVFQGAMKEFHWWTRTRFGIYDQNDPEKSDIKEEVQSFDEYLDVIMGNGLKELTRELKENGSSVRIFGDYSPAYMWDPKNWYDLVGNQGCSEPRVVAGHHIRHIWPPAKILMIFRHPTPRLFSRFMSRIPRTASLSKAGVKEFHKFVKQSIALYTKCFHTSSVRECAYDTVLHRNAQVRLVEGMYPVFMADWLRIWPREQMLILRYEDYGGHERETMEDLIHFMGLTPLNKKGMDNMMKFDVVNSGAEEYATHGDMLPETKKLLDDFYQPFVDMFALVLNDERFLWKDVYTPT